MKTVNRMPLRHPTITSGFTVLEVIIAIVIFAVTNVALLSAIMTADRIKGRGSAIQQATLLAGNELERLKGTSIMQLPFTDTSYTVQSNKRSYTVERRRVSDSAFGTGFQSSSAQHATMTAALEDTASLSEVEVVVRWGHDDHSLVRFRLLHGSYQ